jgi:hypothetical protein
MIVKEKLNAYTGKPMKDLGTPYFILEILKTDSGYDGTVYAILRTETPSVKYKKIYEHSILNTPSTEAIDVHAYVTECERQLKERCAAWATEQNVENYLPELIFLNNDSVIGGLLEFSPEVVIDYLQPTAKTNELQTKIRQHRSIKNI